MRGFDAFYKLLLNRSDQYGHIFLFGAEATAINFWSLPRHRSRKTPKQHRLGENNSPLGDLKG